MAGEAEPGHSIWHATVVARKKRKEMASSEESDQQKVGEAKAETGERFTFFFGAESPFSQWHSAVFAVDGVEYNCAEQYMMHRKAGQLL